MNVRALDTTILEITKMQKIILKINYFKYPIH